MRRPLRYQILFPFALVLLGTIVAVSALSAILATGRARAQIEDQLQSIAATLANSNFPLTNAVLREMHGLSGAEFVLIDSNGQLQARSSDVITAALPNPSATDHWQQLHLGAPIQIVDQRYFPMVLAMNGRGSQSTGKLHILYPEHIWQEARSEAAWPPLIIGGVALIATALIALMLASRLTRPILELRSQVNRIAQADYSPMLLPVRDDEIRELAADVNHMARRLAEMESAVRRSERLTLLGQLGGGLAHNLRNNVTGALMAVQIHARKCDADQESLEVARRQLALTEENLKQFLAAPHGNPGFVAALNCVPCNPTDIIHEVVDLVDPSLRHRHVHLSVVEHHFAGSLPPGERAGVRGRNDISPSIAQNREPFTPDHPDLHADPNQLRQLLMNLVLNVADAAGPHGWVRIESELFPMTEIRSEGAASFESDFSAPSVSSVVNNPPQIILRVIDNGPGPPLEIVKRLFEPFVTGKREGVGLGLAVAQQIAASHAGAIVFHRTPSETCFEVHLPIHQSPEESGAMHLQAARLQPIASSH